MSLDFDALEADFGINATDYFADVFKRLTSFRRDGLIEYDKHSLMVPPTGQLLIRQLAMTFDIPLPAESRQQFSRLL